MDTILLNITTQPVIKKPINKPIVISDDKPPPKKRFQKKSIVNSDIAPSFKKRKLGEPITKPGDKINKKIDDSKNDEGKQSDNTVKKFPLFNKHEKDPKYEIDVCKAPTTIEEMFTSSELNFSDMSIHQHISVNLEREGIKKPTAVQEKAIPAIFTGQNVMVCSQTGSGKTLAYAIPIIQALQSITPPIKREDGVHAIVMCPTKELCQQTLALFKKVSVPFQRIVSGILSGGEARKTEKNRIKHGLSIIVATPGRLLDHLRHTENLRKSLKVRCVVFDEADRLLDEGFQKDIESIWEIITNHRMENYDPMAILKNSKKPAVTTDVDKIVDNDITAEETMPLNNMTSQKMQVLLVSATLPKKVMELAKFTMKEYIYIDPFDNASNAVEDSNRIPVIPAGIQQKYVVTNEKTKLVVLSAFIIGQAKSENFKMFVFMAVQTMVDYHCELFQRCLVSKDDESEDAHLDVELFKLHAGIDTQDRAKNLKAFREAKRAVLFCTDLVARGVDVPHADYVVQYTPPQDQVTYVHRVGRTGRVGKKGHSLIFLAEHETGFVPYLQKTIKTNLTAEKQENILQHLVPFMSQTSRVNSQQSAEMLQNRFEEAVSEDAELKKMACAAYNSWSHFYNHFPKNIKEYFNFHNIHQGHIAKSFALQMSPSDIRKSFRKQDENSTKRLNRKLANHPDESAVPKKTISNPRKQSRSSAVFSEYDSGLSPTKKKQKIK